MAEPGASVTSSPSPSTPACPVTSAGSTRSDSSVRLPRLLYGIPAALHPMSPCAGLPVPTPSTIRLPDTYCNVLICFAAQLTGRRASSITPKPIVIRSVTAAAVASTTVLSSMGALATRWSVDQTESSPVSSASRALARTSPRIGFAGSGVEVGRITPIFTVIPPGNPGSRRPVPCHIGSHPGKRPVKPSRPGPWRSDDTAKLRDASSWARYELRFLRGGDSVLGEPAQQRTQPLARAVYRLDVTHRVRVELKRSGE